MSDTQKNFIRENAPDIVGVIEIRHNRDKVSPLLSRVEHYSKEGIRKKGASPLQSSIL